MENEAERQKFEEVLRNRILFIGGPEDAVPQVATNKGTQVYTGCPNDLIAELLAARASESSPPQPKCSCGKWPHEDFCWMRTVAAATAPSAPPTELSSALRGLMYLTDQGREGGLILSRYDGKPLTNGDQDVIDRAYIAAEAALAATAPAQVRGTWSEHCIQRAFVEGAAWWQFHANGATMFASERDAAEAEAIKKYGAPSAPTATQEKQNGPMDSDSMASVDSSSDWAGRGDPVPVQVAPTATDWMRQAQIVVKTWRTAMLTQNMVRPNFDQLHVEMAKLSELLSGEHAGADKEKQK